MTYTSQEQSNYYLNLLEQQEKLKPNRIPGVKSILVILSSKGMVFDREALRQKILISYPEAAIFFASTNAKPVGSIYPEYVDLLIDFTQPGAHQSFFAAKKFRKLAKFCVGRNAGLFRKKIYDRVYDEKAKENQSTSEHLEKEREVQKKVLELIGVSILPVGDTPKNQEKELPLKLPSMKNL